MQPEAGVGLLKSEGEVQLKRRKGVEGAGPLDGKGGGDRQEEIQAGGPQAVTLGGHHGRDQNFQGGWAGGPRCSHHRARAGLLLARPRT